MTAPYRGGLKDSQDCFPELKAGSVDPRSILRSGVPARQETKTLLTFDCRKDKILQTNYSVCT